MSSFRNALFLFAFVVVVVGVNSAAFQQSDYEPRSSVWSAELSLLDMVSLWENENENTVGVNGVKGCCNSEVWAATMFTEFRNEEGGRKQITRCKDVMNVDPATGRWSDEATINNVTISKIMLCDESGTILYNFSKTEKWCKTTRMSRSCKIRPDPCFSSNGTLAGSFSFGAGPGALKTQLWNYDLSRDSGDESTLHVLLTPDDCVPILVAQKTVDSARKSTFFGGSVFTNFTAFIPDPSVFTPPSYC